MWLIEARIERLISPQELAVHLKTIDDKLRTTECGGQTILKLPGVNVCEDPFPSWLKEALQNAGYEYDEINFTMRKIEERKEEQLDWIEKEIRPWMKSFPEGRIYESVFTVRALEMIDDVSGLSSF